MKTTQSPIDNREALLTLDDVFDDRVGGWPLLPRDLPGGGEIRLKGDLSGVFDALLGNHRGYTPATFCKGYELFVTDRHTVFGAIAYDRHDDVASPFDKEAGNGRLYRRAPAADAGEQVLFFQALGLGTDGKPDLAHPAVAAQLEGISPKGKPTVRQRRQAWQQARVEGAIGETLAVLVDCQAGIRTVFSLHDPHPLKKIADAVWVPDPDSLAKIRYRVLGELELTADQVVSPGEDAGELLYAPQSRWERWLERYRVRAGRAFDLRWHELRQARRHTRPLLDLYTSWANKEFYGYRVGVIDRDSGILLSTFCATRWGFVGFEACEQAMGQAMQATVRALAMPKN